MENRVKVNTRAGSYEAVIGENLPIGKLLLKVHPICRVLVVSDDTVGKLYGNQCLNMLKESGFETSLFCFPHGEQSKNLSTAQDILKECAEQELTRTDLLLALGGGVVGDITGFVSAIYLRGVDFVQVPTSFLAAVDSSVGGKTAVDLKEGKNLVGAFHQPIAVFCDTDMFKTLPDEVYADGTAEAIKHGMILDEELFLKYEKGERNNVEEVTRNISLKASIVEQDELDKGIRNILNFGHTPGHAVELLSGYTISHGYAVAIGMVIMTRYIEKNHRIEEGSTERLVRTLQKHHLPTECEYGAQELAEAALMDKKRSGETISIVVLKKIGQAELENVSIYELAEIFEDGLN